MNGIDEQTPTGSKKTRKTSRANGKRKKNTQPKLPRYHVECGDKVTIVEGYGVTEADLASARAMVLGLPVASTGGM